MKFSVNTVIQILAVTAHMMNQAYPLLPPRAQFWATVMLSAVQGVSAVLAHFSNPDGTPASQPYVKKK